MGINNYKLMGQINRVKKLIKKNREKLKKYRPSFFSKKTIFCLEPFVNSVW